MVINIIVKYFLVNQCALCCCRCLEIEKTASSQCENWRFFRNLPCVFRVIALCHLVGYTLIIHGFFRVPSS
jgi:hypothetical protein